MAKKFKEKIQRPITKAEYEKIKKKNFDNIPSGYTVESFWRMTDFLFEKGQFYVYENVEEG